MSAILQGKKIVLGVTGGIAAYKAVELLRLLVGAGVQVQVVMTQSAQEFVTPLTFQALSGTPVRTALFGPGADPLEHISLAQAVDAIIIAPATANCLGKMAMGIGDDLLTTLILAADPAHPGLPGHERQNVRKPGGAREPEPVAAAGISYCGTGDGGDGLRRLWLRTFAGTGSHHGSPGRAFIPQRFIGLQDFDKRRPHA